MQTGILGVGATVVHGVGRPWLVWGAAPVAARPRLTTETDVDVEQIQRTLAQLLPRYKVLLHNDDHNTMDHVVYALQRVVQGLSLAEALRIMYEAHTSGVAVV